MSATRFALVDDVSLHYRSDVRGDYPTLVFVNSLGTDMRIWDAVIEYLPEPLNLFCYDKRGHGLSDDPDEGWNIDTLADDLSALMDQQGISASIVCGISVGGMIALSLSERHPERVGGLILCDTGHRIGTAEMWANRIAEIRGSSLDAQARPILKRWFSESYRRKYPAELNGWRNMLTRTPVHGYVATCEAIAGADLEQAARAVSVPTLCACGSNDAATPPALVAELAALIPKASFDLIKGPRHLPCIEKPRELAGRITAFLEENHFV